MPLPAEPMTVVSLVSLAALCVLGLRKLVLMDGLLGLRTIFLTALLWAAAFYLFCLAWPMSDENGYGCAPHNEVACFTISEM